MFARLLAPALFASLFALSAVATPAVARSQTPQAATPVSTPGIFEGVAIGTPVASLRERLGDPIKIESSGQTVIWRYLTHGGGTYLDLIVKNNTVQSVTLVSLFNDFKYLDPNGIAFGATPDQVRAKLGTPARESTNADDGSLDLWYRAAPYGWVYEFQPHELRFIQLVASPNFLSTLPAGPATATGDGTSTDRAIWIRPSNLLFVTVWLGKFFAVNQCGTNGHWTQTGSPQLRSVDGNPTAAMVVSAVCSDGGTKRDFYFNTNGDTQATPENHTIYLDTNQLRQMIPSPAASATPAPPAR